MQLEYSCDPKFDELWERLHKLYPQDLFDLSGVGYQLDHSKFSKEFFSSSVTADVSIDPNANVDGMSVINYTTESDKPKRRLDSLHVLWRELRKLYGQDYADACIDAHINGDGYIHDDYGIAGGMPYCFNFSTYDILTKGLPMVEKIVCSPPKYLTSFKSQLEQFTVIASNSTLGATGLADILITMSYYVKNILRDCGDSHYKFASEEDCWTYVKEQLISTMYTVNQPMRANQSPFTNISVYDDEFLDGIIADYLFPDGSSPDKNIVKRLQNIFLEAVDAELHRTPITFPVTTACLSVHEPDKEDSNRYIQDRESLRNFVNHNMNYGFMNFYFGDSATLSSCCRLRSKKLVDVVTEETHKEYFNSFGSGSSKIGSIGVFSIDYPRLAFKSCGDTEEFKSLLAYYTEMSSRINHAKRCLIQKRINNGNLPLYTHGFMDLKKQYSTTGVNGQNEAIEVMGYSVLNEDGQQFALDCMKVVNDLNDKFEKELGYPHNVEQVPGEGLSVKFAKKDKLMGYQDTYDMYSNQFIPLTVQADLLDRIRIQGLFDAHFSGGSILHLNFGEKITDPEAVIAILDECVKRGVIYVAINYNYQMCEKGHLSVGNGDLCGTCGLQVVDNYTRVVGFLTNVKNWAKTRREKDYPLRRWYKA